MSDIEARLTELTDRLQRVEDELAIIRLIASYGPLVDSGSAAEVGALWTEDGIYDVDELYMGSRADIVAMVNGESHQGLIHKGTAHFLGPAAVTVRGDTAVAVCESVLMVHHKERFVPARAGIHHWELTRTPDGWQTTRRTSRLLDGTPDGHALAHAGGRGEARPDSVTSTPQA
ncbi:nuclear transport factor 2 family protein [Nocardioides daejeonensis]|uniref:nuclear transport factor 2 family protein n=1 Tax=Nocardioides daejeonensis TaxID=1046556 RepID=UPI000D75026D|nr:nuclear transport factor 2 family protein [Nocardioides daejeonensis]